MSRGEPEHPQNQIPGILKRNLMQIWKLIPEIFTKIEGIFNCQKMLRKLSQFWKNLLKILEEILSCEEFLKYCFDMSMKFWISFGEIKWNFNKDVRKKFIRIMKIFWKKYRTFRVYFAEINFRMRKILRKFHTNVEEILGWFRKNFDWTWKILKECEGSLRTRKFVKCPRKF